MSLIERGINLYTKTYEGNLFYHHISNYDIIMELDRRGLDLSIRNALGKHMLHKQDFLQFLKMDSEMFRNIISVALKHDYSPLEIERNVRFSLSFIKYHNRDPYIYESDRYAIVRLFYNKDDETNNCDIADIIILNIKYLEEQVGLNIMD